jgi:hypothetical protein
MDDIGDKCLEKRLARIERWFKRCVAACRSGSWSSALMEIECMEAETREFHDELWRAAEDASNERERGRDRFASSCGFGFRVVFAAVAIVLSAVFPLSMETDGGYAARSAVSIELLSSSEAEILSALRENLSNANMGRVVVAVEIPAKTDAPVPPDPAPAGAAMAAQMPRVVVKPVPAPERSAAAAGAAGVQGADDGGASRDQPSVEDVISLIQVGQRALRVSEPAITVVK